MYDFGVLVLDEGVTSIKPIKVNYNSSSPENSEILKIIGFGATAEYGDKPQNLQELEVPVISNEICESLYSSVADDDFDEQIDFNENTMLCAGYLEGGKDACQGDSGGPIFSFGESGVEKLMGTVSWGVGCGQASLPGVYARTSAIKEWLQCQICLFSSNKPHYCNKRQCASCINSPIDWYDEFGDDCNYYGVKSECHSMGDEYEKFGKTANEACCVCGGGTEVSSNSSLLIPSL